MIHNAYVSPECLIIFAVGRPVKIVTRSEESRVFSLDSKFGGLPSQHVKSQGRFLYFKSVQFSAHISGDTSTKLVKSFLEFAD